MPIRDNRDILPRPEWLKWYIKDWLNAVADFEADQYGWYHRLLMHAALQGNPPGYLPSDERSLKRIAHYVDPAKSTYGSVLSAAGGNPLLNDYIKEQETKWQEVLDKFEPSEQYEGLLFNLRMKKTIDEVCQIREGRARGGEEAAKLLHGKKTKESTSKVLETSTGASSATEDESNQQKTTQTDFPELPKPLEETSESSSANFQLALISSSATPRASSSLSSSLVDGKPSLLGKRSKRRIETEFDSEKFQIDNRMREWFRKEFPELKEDDYQFIRNQFCNARETYGARAKDWWASFRYFVTNRMAEEDFVARLPSKRNNPETGANRNGHKYESNLAERERLAREEDEWLRVRKSGGGDSGESSKALQLPTDELNRKGQNR